MLSGSVGAVSRALDERVNLKHVHRRLQAVSKVLIVTTFFEDALRVLLTFNVQQVRLSRITSMRSLVFIPTRASPLADDTDPLSLPLQNSMRIAGWQSPALHTALPVFSFVVQMGGALLVALPGQSSTRSQVGVIILLCWCLFHPVMYSQYENWEFVLETLTIMGGLLILLSHCMLLDAAAANRTALPVAAAGEKLAIKPAKAVGPKPVEGELAARAHTIQAVGRILIVAVFIYYAFDHVHGYATHLSGQEEMSDWLGTLVETAATVFLLAMCALVIIGIKSRWVALLLALLMALSACWMHPFWIYTFSTKHYRMQGVAHMEGYEVDAFTMGDHQRYFFFQTMSTVGALLLLVVHGPGKLSMDEQQGQLVLITTHDA